jgi:vitamin B12 transporter
MAFDYAPGDDLDLHLDFTYLDATEPGGDRELRRPRYSGRLVADRRLLGDRLRLQAGVAYIGNHDDTSYAAFPPLRVELDAYTLLHCTARYRFNERFELTGRIENLTDAHYQDVFGYATPGRSGYLGIRVTL